MQESDTTVVDNQEQAGAAFTHAAERTPSPQDWGFYAYGDAPSAIGGGVGAFCWFGTQVEMLEFIAEHLAFVSPGPTDSDSEAVAFRVRSIISQAHEAPPEELRTNLNEALRQYSQIDWWGQMQELLTGDTGFANRVRQSWQESILDNADQYALVSDAVLPVLPDQMTEFCVFLSEYGL